MIEPGRYESLVEKQIREAMERGAFDNLPGAGKPLPCLDEPDDEMWWVRRYVEREGEYLRAPSAVRPAGAGGTGRHRGGGTPLSCGA